MRVESADHISDTNAAGKQPIVVVSLLLLSCLLAVLIPVMVLDSVPQYAAIGILALIMLGGIVCSIFDIPLIALLRFVFIFSFFFKGELNFYKIAELEDPSGFNISFTLISALLLIGYDLAIGNDQCDVSVMPGSFRLLVPALFIMAAIAVVFGGSNLIGWFSLWSFSTLVIIAFATASHFSQRDRLIELAQAMAFGLLFTGMISLSQYFADFPSNLPFFGTGTDDELLGTQSIVLSRVPAFLRTPTEMAWSVSTMLPIIGALVICRVKGFAGWQKLLFLAASIFAIAAVILSLARGSWISLIVGLLIIASFGWYRLSISDRKGYLLSVAGILLLGTIVLLPLSPRIYDRLNGDDDGSAMIRVPLMETAIRMIKDNPLVGVGLSGYRTNMTRYDETSVFVSQMFPNPVHNVFAHITAEIGIPGGIVFCLLIACAMYECWKAIGFHDRLLFALGLGLLAGLIAFVISAMKEPGSLGSGRPPLRTLFLLFGIALALSRIRRQNLI